YSLLGEDLFTILFIVFLVLLVLTLIRPLMRKVLWRVRNRLFVTYFLVGVLPVVLIVALGLLLTYALAGSMAAYLAQSELNHRIDQLLENGRQLAEDIETGRRRPLATEFPIQAVVQFRNRTIASEGAIREIPSWSRPGFKGIVRTNTPAYFLVAHSEAGSA